MPELFSVEKDISFNHKPAMMINWRVLFNCNLDCSYCNTHDNSATPVDFDQCKKTVEFIFQYVDLILALKPKYEKRAALNLIGGEPFAHPDIVKILNTVREMYNTTYRDRWELSVCVTTNGLFGNNLVKKCLSLIDQWTISYHAETLKKQKDLIIKNIENLHSAGEKVEVRVMAHPDEDKFKETQTVHHNLVQKGINALMKPIIDNEYTDNETKYFKVFWLTKEKDNLKNYSTSSGITCCSESPLILNHDKKTKTNFIPDNNFKGWYCGLNWAFLFVSHTGAIYHNSGCRVSNLSNLEEPIGHVNNYSQVIDNVKQQIESRAFPVIVCPKDRCVACGMCAPKAKTKEDFLKVMQYRLNDTSILDFKD